MSDTRAAQERPRPRLFILAALLQNRGEIVWKIIYSGSGRFG